MRQMMHWRKNQNGSWKNFCGPDVLMDFHCLENPFSAAREANILRHTDLEPITPCPVCQAGWEAAQGTVPKAEPRAVPVMHWLDGLQKHVACFAAPGATDKLLWTMMSPRVRARGFTGGCTVCPTCQNEYDRRHPKESEHADRWGEGPDNSLIRCTSVPQVERAVLMLSYGLSRAIAQRWENQVLVSTLVRQADGTPTPVVPQPLVRVEPPQMEFLDDLVGGDE